MSLFPSGEVAFAKRRALTNTKEKSMATASSWVLNDIAKP